jgi:hypothetical protein
MYGHHPTPGAYAPMAPYSYPPSSNYSAFSYGQHPGPFPPWTLKDSPVSSPATALQLAVPLADFCTRYKISKSDEEKLALLEYKPGNNAVTTLGTEDWKEVKFTTLGWKGFLTAHRRFIHDVKNGVWTDA